MDVNMVNRYSEFLNKILIGSQSQWLQDKHQQWVTQTTGGTKALTFYERMKIDLVMRQKKEDEIENHLNSPSKVKDLEDEDPDDEDGMVELDDMDDDEREKYLKVKAMAESLGIPFQKALEIHEMTSKKGIYSKTLEEEKEEEELLLSPKLKEYALKVKQIMQESEPFRREWDDQMIQIPENDDDIENPSGSRLDLIQNKTNLK